MSSPDMTNRMESGSNHGVKHDQIDSLRRDLEGLAEKVTNLTRKQLSGVMADAKDVGKEKLADVEEAIRRKPTQAALIAAGVGFVAALLLRR